ncbi:hypothetical protein [Egicoccus sp. AB-alg6-2]|uniref:hypothetical protein n=1 Tax=Egicoccus sp. AB-alg6-2 TaxID=3242692 RepID=UPI00359D9C04
MASDTAPSAAVGRCVGFAEPADILPRLRPDESYPARLAGPHAWHPWALTIAPPTDRHLRLALPTGTTLDTAAELLDRLEAQLGRTPWPPDGQLDLRRQGNQLHCRDGDARRSLIEVNISPATPDRAHVEVVNRDGWPILDELAALADRISRINIDTPATTDLTDLANWVEHKMAAPAQASGLTTSLTQLLSHQARTNPAMIEHLQTILAHRASTDALQHRVLDYFAERLTHCQHRLHRGQRPHQ